MEKHEEEETKKILSTLHNLYPNLHHYLTFSTPLELLVATILSAQVRDEVVNATTPLLFKKYKNAQDYADADIAELAYTIRSITFGATKAKHIKEACQRIVEKHKGTIPHTMEELTSLPGIGRKSANVILQNAFGIVEGVVVDTHVLRVAYRLGFTSTEKNAEKSEKELMELLPKTEWKTFPWLMKSHGRAVCKAPVPSCSSCSIEKLCPKQGVAKEI